MRMNWLVCAAATVCMVAPAQAQTNTTLRSSGAEYTNVDTSELRRSLDDLRTRLDAIQKNSDLAFAASDPVHTDLYRRANAILIGQASDITLEALENLGPSTRIPPGLGTTRTYVAEVGSQLTRARMSADYGAPIDKAAEALDEAFAGLDRPSRAMTGSNLASLGR